MRSCSTAIVKNNCTYKLRCPHGSATPMSTWPSATQTLPALSCCIAARVRDRNYFMPSIIESCGVKLFWGTQTQRAIGWRSPQHWRPLLPLSSGVENATMRVRRTTMMGCSSGTRRTTLASRHGGAPRDRPPKRGRGSVTQRGPWRTCRPPIRTQGEVMIC